MSERTTGYQRLFAELKRRHVFKVAAIYGAVAFAVLQVADPLATALGLPDSFLSLVLALLMLGFPVALVLAWAFEVTPEGVQKTESAAPGEIEAIVAEPASRRWPSGLLALAGIALLFGGGWWMGQRSGSGTALDLSVQEANAAEFDMVAVLPFENLGGVEENEVLASGLQLDLQAKLGRVDALRVIWPGSVREYRASTKTDREIADELGADFILRGSVRRSGERVRVDVQLIDAGTSESLWGEQFDRDVTPDNLFDIQSEIAGAVARRLATRMSPADLAALDEGPPSTSMGALAAYNQARELYNLGGGYFGETWNDAIEQAERAVELDPAFVEAWSFLARLNSLVSQGDASRTEPAREAVLRAEALAPESVRAITARAFYTYYVENEFEQALTLLERVEPLAPSDVDVASGIAFLHRRLGRWDASLEAFKKVIALDPRSSHLLEEYAGTLIRLGRMTAADEVAERALQIAPASPSVRQAKIESTIARHGDVGRARSLAEELRLDPTDLTEAQILTWLALLEKDLDEAARRADGIPGQTEQFAESRRLFQRGWVAALRGEDATAIGDSIAALGLTPGTPGAAQMWSAAAAAFAGDEDRAWALMDEGVRLVEASGDLWVEMEARSNRAAIKALFGSREGALDELGELVDQPGADLSRHGLQLNRTWDRLRDDPRFDELVERRRAFEERAAREAEADRPWLP
ncbi:MAG TPA: hypothetical protein VLA33_05385 [Gemmatimonadota bacterium]|nr:hypothetical protein [Gemmatimonadota bacterium]